MRFSNRGEAGLQLADRLKAYAGKADTLVLALPRGGVPVGHEIARSLGVPLDVFLVRKLGLPGHEELAIGAIAAGGICILNEELVKELNIDAEIIHKITEREERELDRRYHAYREGAPFPQVKGKTIILVDDGLATGSTMRAAILALRQESPSRIIVAVPVAPSSVYGELTEADEIICLQTPEPFYSVGQWYDDFAQLSDVEVQTILLAAETHANENTA